MKIIDLLNKIANGEEIPKCFKVNNHTWEWNVNSYQNELYGEFAVTGLRYDLSNLNDEVEIIEDEKTKMLPLLNELYTYNMTVEFNKLIRKINEIIKHINKEEN